MISPTAAADYSERVQDMYTFSELILNIREVGKIDSRKMQGQSAFSILLFIIFVTVGLLQIMLSHNIRAEI